MGLRNFPLGNFLEPILINNPNYNATYLVSIDPTNSISHLMKLLHVLVIFK